MIFDMTGLRIERPIDETDFSDLTTTSGAVRSGPSQWVGETQLEIPFTPEAAESERWPILRRIITKDAAEEQKYIQAENAITSNNAWRTNTSPQVDTQAQAIRDDASITSTEVPTYLRQLAQGTQVLNRQIRDLSVQNNNIIELLLKLLNRD